MPSTNAKRREQHKNNPVHRNKRKQNSQNYKNKRKHKETEEEKKNRLEKQRASNNKSRGKLSATQLINRVPSNTASGSQLFAFSLAFNFVLKNTTVNLCQNVADTIFQFAGPDCPKQFHWIHNGVKVMMSTSIGESQGQARAVFEIVKCPTTCNPNILKIEGMDGTIICKQLQWMVNVNWPSRTNTEQQHADKLEPMCKEKLRSPSSLPQKLN